MAGVFRARGRLPREPAVKLDICKGSVSSTTKQGAMSDNREPEVTGAPSADARSVEVAEAVAGARGPAYFTLQASMGYRRPTGSPEHSQDIGDAVIEPLHADREVQAIFAAQEGGMDLPSSQNRTPQPFVYDSVLPSRSHSRFSARSQNNELVEMVTRLVADNRAEVIRREQQAANQARLEMELAILQTQLQLANAEVVRDAAGSDAVSSALQLGLTSTAASVLSGKPIVTQSLRNAAAAVSCTVVDSVSTQQARSEALALPTDLRWGGERIFAQGSQSVTSSSGQPCGVQPYDIGLHAVSAARAIDNLTLSSVRPDVMYAPRVVTEYIHTRPTGPEIQLSSQTVYRPMYSVAGESIFHSVAGDRFAANQREIRLFPPPIGLETANLPGVIRPAAGEAYSYGRWPYMPHGYEPLSTLPRRISQTSDIGLPPVSERHAVDFPSVIQVPTVTDLRQTVVATSTDGAVAATEIAIQPRAAALMSTAMTSTADYVSQAPATTTRPTLLTAEPMNGAQNVTSSADAATAVSGTALVATATAVAVGMTSSPSTVSMPTAVTVATSATGTLMTAVTSATTSNSTLSTSAAEGKPPLPPSTSVTTVAGVTPAATATTPSSATQVVVVRQH